MLRVSALSAALVAVLSLSASPGYGILIASDDFTMTGELNGAAGGMGWSGAWSADTGVTQVVVAPSNFSYDVPGGGSIAPTTALSVTGNSGSAVQRALASSQSDDVYISFLTQWSEGALSANDFGVWYFNTNANPNIGWKTNEGPAHEDLMARLSNGNEAYPAGQFDVGDTAFVVGKLSKTGGGNYDRIEIWVNPANGEQLVPQAVGTTGSSGIDLVTDLGIRTANIDGDDNILFGQLRLGTAWEDVVPQSGAVVQPQIIFEDPFEVDPMSNGWTQESFDNDNAGEQAGAIFSDGIGVVFQSDGINANDFDTNRITRTVDASGFEDITVLLDVLENDTLEGGDSISILIDAGDGMGFIEVASLSDDFTSATLSALLPETVNDSEFQLRIQGVTNVENYFLDHLSVLGRPQIVPEPASAALLGLAGLALIRRRRRVA